MLRSFFSDRFFLPFSLRSFAPPPTLLLSLLPSLLLFLLDRSFLLVSGLHLPSLPSFRPFHCTFLPFNHSFSVSNRLLSHIRRARPELLVLALGSKMAACHTKIEELERSVVVVAYAKFT
jgi:hypothetical protein